jgi:hypothetical protein
VAKIVVQIEALRHGLEAPPEPGSMPWMQGALDHHAGADEPPDDARPGPVAASLSSPTIAIPTVTASQVSRRL